MKKRLSYLLWSLIAVAFVFSSIAIPVALSTEQEEKVSNKVAVLQIEEQAQDYLSEAVSLEEKAGKLFNADLNTRIARNAYMSEMTLEEIINNTNAFLLDWIAEYQKEFENIPGIIPADGATVLSKAEIHAVLYESPSGSSKISYWQIEYLWHMEQEAEFTEEAWPMFYVMVLCDPATGVPYLINYEYVPWREVSENTGTSAFANAIGFKEKIQGNLNEVDKGYVESNYTAGSEVIMRSKINYYFILEGEELCLVKSMFIDGATREQMQLVPLDKIQ